MSTAPGIWSASAARAATTTCWSPCPRKRLLDAAFPPATPARVTRRSEEHTSELQSLMRLSYAVFCLKNNKLTHLTNIFITPQTRTHTNHNIEQHHVYTLFHHV